MRRVKGLFVPKIVVELKWFVNQKLKAHQLI